MSDNAHDEAPEFSHEILLADVGRPGRDIRLRPNEEARARIAKRLKTPSVDRLESDLHLAVTRDEAVLTGSFVADLIRECVASLEPTPEHVEEAFELRFLRAAPAEPPAEDDWDAPEVLDGDRIDVGELLVQQLALAMHPFPRKPGAPSLADQYGVGARVSPFAGLADALKSGETKKPDENQ